MKPMMKNNIQKKSNTSWNENIFYFAFGIFERQQHISPAVTSMNLIESNLVNWN